MKTLLTGQMHKTAYRVDFAHLISENYPNGKLPGYLLYCTERLCSKFGDLESGGTGLVTDVFVFSP